MKQLFAAGAVLLLALNTACVKQIKTEVPLGDKKISSLAIAQTIYGETRLPLFPLIDAAIYKGKARPTLERIHPQREAWVATHENILKKVLEGKLSLKIKRASTVQTAMGSSGLMPRPAPPGAFAARGQKIYLPMEDLPDELKEDAMIEGMAQVATNLNVDAVLVSYTRLNVIAVLPFGISASARLESFLVFYGPDGIVTAGRFFSQPTPASGSNPNEFLSLHEQYETYLDRLTDNMLFGKEVPGT